MNKKIAVINDLSGFGKCSLGVAIPIISAHAIQCCPLTTGVFSNQTGYDSFKCVDFTDYMQGFIDEWKKLNPSFNGILTGFISNSAQGDIISSFIDEFRNDDTVVLVDPIMGDDGKIYPCYDEKSVKSVMAISSKADIITPNLTELSLLCGRDYNEVVSSNTLFDEVEQMSSSLGKTVITTGIRLDNKIIANAVYSNGNFDIVESKMLGGSFSGTGDIMASFVISEIVAGNDVLSAVKKAVLFIEKAIEDTIKEPYNTADGINFEKFLNTI